MPAGIVRQLYRIYWQKEFGPGIPRCLKVQNDSESLGSYHRVVGPIAHKLNVSMESLKWRLVKLKLLEAQDEQTLKKLI
jgi:hypothetical protein